MQLERYICKYYAQGVVCRWLLVKLCLEQDTELFIDQYGTPFIRYAEEVSLHYDDIDDIDSTFDSFSAKNENSENVELPDKVSEIPSISSYRHIQRYVNCPIRSKHFKTTKSSPMNAPPKIIPRVNS